MEAGETLQCYLTMTSDLYAWMRHVKVDMFAFIEKCKQQLGGIG
jgi:hypothetical protein